MNSNKEIDSEKLISVKTRQYSDSISKRRKALFKNEELKTHSSHAADLEDMDLIESFKPLEINDVSICTHSNENDYLILETIDLKCLNQSSFKNDTHIIVNPSTEGNVSSPTKILADETPNKISPTEKLKTPNDVSSSAKGVVPKLIRKSLLDNSFKDTVKRKIDCLSPSSKDLEILPSKISKIRTALFPDDNIGLPTKSFYPKPVNNTIKKIHVPSSTSTKRIRHKTGNSFLCNRNKKGRKYLGQINAGVRHNILKPRKKPLKKEAILKAAINIIDNSPLNEYLSNATNQIGQIDSVENVIPIAQSHSKNDKMLNETENKTETFVVKIHKDSGNKKRSHSPSNMDEKRKFFKSSRPKIITVDKRLNIEVQPEEKDPVNVKDNSDLFDFTTFTEFDYGSSIDNILSTLEDKENKESNNVNSNCNNIVNNLPDKNINLMSPTSEMCNRTLSLALNSPKKAKLDINKILENPISQNVFNKPHSLEAMENKYYSIFNMKNKVETEAPITLPNKNITANKKWKSLPKNQMLLDAGQKKFGITQCPECNTVYHMGDPNDEIMHLNNHNATNVLKFNGWKHENVVNQTNDYKIVRISVGDPKIWWKKVHEVLEIVNRDLGFYEMNMNTENSQIYFYIQHKQIVGCLVAEPITTAYKMLETVQDIDLCSETSYPVRCGISRIWVHKAHRRKKIGTALVNCLRFHFAYGGGLSLNDIAFSSPTAEGKVFASKYMGSPNFYVYM